MSTARGWTAALVLVLAVGGALGDDQDIDCNNTSSPNNTATTKLFCKAQDLATEFLKPNIGRKGWFLIFGYHIFLIFKAPIMKNFGKTIQRQTALLDMANLMRLVGQNMLVYMCYYGVPEIQLRVFRNNFFTHSLALIMVDMLALWGIRVMIHMAILTCWGEGIDDDGKEQTETEKEKAKKKKKKDTKEARRNSLYLKSSGDAGFKEAVKRVKDAAAPLKKAKSYLFAGADADDDGDLLWDMETIYVLPYVPPLRCSLIWVSQTILFGLYCLVMNQISATVKTDGQTFVWFMGVLVMCTVGEQQAGESFDFKNWTKIWSMSGGYSLPAKMRLAWRCFCDWSVNSVYRQVLLATTAILLSTEGPIDFVKDVLAIVFISTLDDPNDDQKDGTQEMFYDHECEYYETCKKDEKTNKESKDEKPTDGKEFSAADDPKDFADKVTAAELAMYMWQVLDTKWQKNPTSPPAVTAREPSMHDKSFAEPLLSRESV